MAYIFITKKEKTNWKYILIIVILALIGVGETLYLAKQEVKLPETKLPQKFIQDETADWKTYRIGEFYCGYIGYEIKYPPDLIAKGWEEEPIGRCPAATLHSVSFIKIKDSEGIEVLTIDTMADPDQLIYKAYEKEGAVPIKINQVEGLKIKEGLLVFSKPEKLYRISTENYLEVKELLSQMLSTFRFIE